MLKQLITRNYHLGRKDTTQILNKVFTNYRDIGKKNHYCLEVNKRRIGFSQRSDYHNEACYESKRANESNNPYKSMKNWNIMSFFLLMVGITGYFGFIN